MFLKIRLSISKNDYDSMNFMRADCLSQSFTFIGFGVALCSLRALIFHREYGLVWLVVLDSRGGVSLFYTVGKSGIYIPKA